MEKQLNEITLKETGMYNSDYIFYWLFSKNKITTLEQLFDDELMNKIIQNAKLQTRNQLKGYISIMKCRYLGIPLLEDKFLEYRAVRPTKSRKGLPIDLEFFFEEVDFNSMGFNSNHVRLIINFAKTFGSRLENMKLINFFKKLLDFPISISLQYSIKMYIESYEKAHGEEPEEEPAGTDTVTLQKLRALRAERASLIEVRDSLNRQIEDIDAQIKILSFLPIDKDKKS